MGSWHLTNDTGRILSPDHARPWSCHSRQETDGLPFGLLQLGWNNTALRLPLPGAHTQGLRALTSPQPHTNSPT